jgi:hypothetical protein
MMPMTTVAETAREGTVFPLHRMIVSRFIARGAMQLLFL